MTSESAKKFQGPLNEIISIDSSFPLRSKKMHPEKFPEFVTFTSSIIKISGQDVGFSLGILFSHIKIIRESMPFIVV